MARVTAKVLNPDNIEVTMSITMTIGHWKVLREQMGTEWPAWDVGRQIRDTISKVENVIFDSDK